MDVGHALFRQLGRQYGSSAFGVAVHGGIDQEHAFFFRFIGGPVDVLVHDVFDVVPPYRSVERADHLDVQLAGLAQKIHDEGPVFPYDVGVVPAGIIQPVPVEVHFVVEDPAAQGSKGTEGIGGEQDAVFGIEGYHNFRPVDHRSFYEGNGMFAEGTGFLFQSMHLQKFDF